MYRNVILSGRAASSSPGPCWFSSGLQFVSIESGDDESLPPKKCCSKPLDKSFDVQETTHAFSSRRNEGSVALIGLDCGIPLPKVERKFVTAIQSGHGLFQ